MARTRGFEVTACQVWEDEEKLQAAPKAFLAALRRGRRARLRLFDVMAFHIGRAPFDEFGERDPAVLCHRMYHPTTVPGAW